MERFSDLRRRHRLLRILRPPPARPRRGVEQGEAADESEAGRRAPCGDVPVPRPAEAGQTEDAHGDREQTGHQRERFAQHAEHRPDQQRRSHGGGPGPPQTAARGPDGAEHGPETDHARQGVGDGGRCPEQHLVRAGPGEEQQRGEERRGGHEGQGGRPGGQIRRRAVRPARLAQGTQGTQSRAAEEEETGDERDHEEGGQQLRPPHPVGVEQSGQEGVGDAPVLGLVEVRGDAEDAHVPGLPEGAPVVGRGAHVQAEEGADREQRPGARGDGGRDPRECPPESVRGSGVLSAVVRHPCITALREGRPTHRSSLQVAEVSAPEPMPRRCHDTAMPRQGDTTTWRRPDTATPWHGVATALSSLRGSMGDKRVRMPPVSLCSPHALLHGRHADRGWSLGRRRTVTAAPYPGRAARRRVRRRSLRTYSRPSLWSDRS